MENVKELIKEALEKAQNSFLSQKYLHARIISEQILKIEDNLSAKLLLSLCICYQGNPIEAKNILMEEIQKYPTDHKIYNNLGLIESFCENHNEAIRFFELSSKYTNDCTPTINKALELSKLEKFNEAENLLLTNNDNISIFNLAGIYHKQLKCDKAEELYRKLPDNFYVAKFNLGSLLCLQNKREGFDLLENRWKAFDHLVEIRKQINLPDWDGSENKIVVVFSEQGVGDCVMFSRYIKELEKKCKVYTYFGEKFDRLFNFNKWKGEKADYAISVNSLIRFFDYIPEPIKLNPSYDGDLSIYKPNKLIGLCWRGSPNHKDDENRNIELNKFENLTHLENTKWFTCGWNYKPTLKYNGKIIDWENNCKNVKIIDTSKIQKDVSALAGVINQMDYIITVDTATAHISGSLGKKTLLLIKDPPDWRWGINKNKTEWYPSIDIIRSFDISKIGEWIINQK